MHACLSMSNYLLRLNIRVANVRSGGWAARSGADPERSNCSSDFKMSSDLISARLLCGVGGRALCLFRGPKQLLFKKTLKI